MRSSGTPSRIASTTPRTIARTSSSGSEAVHTSVPVTGAIPASPSSSTGAPTRRRLATTASSAAATPGVDTGRRPAAASSAAPSNSASRYTVRNVTPTTPRPIGVTAPSSPDASPRRAETPTEFVGTTTVTGASASDRFARATASRKACDAGRPYAVGTTVIGTGGSYGGHETPETGPGTTWSRRRGRSGSQRPPEELDRELDRLRRDLGVCSRPHAHALRSGNRFEHLDRAGDREVLVARHVEHQHPAA